MRKRVRSSSISTSETIRARALPFGRVLGILATIVYAIVFAELFLRVLAPQPLTPRYVTRAPWGVRMNVPNSVYHQHSTEMNVEIRINSQGMRADRVFPLVKPPRTCRIALFGDSYFVGYEVNLEDSFAARLQALLRDKGFNAEVLNFAVSGFGQAEMLRTMKAQGLAFHPDVALIEWHSSDLDDNIRSGLYRLTPNGLEDTGAIYAPATKVTDFLQSQAVYRWLVENSHLYSALRERLASLVKHALADMRRGKAAPVATGERRASALDIALLKATIGAAEDAKARALVVDIPDFPSRTSFISNFKYLPQDWIASGPFVSPIGAFNAAARPYLKLYFEHGMGHLTPTGNALLASTVADRLVRDDSLQECPQP